MMKRCQRMSWVVAGALAAVMQQGVTFADITSVEPESSIVSPVGGTGSILVHAEEDSR